VVEWYRLCMYILCDEYLYPRYEYYILVMNIISYVVNIISYVVNMYILRDEYLSLLTFGVVFCRIGVGDHRSI
jgi:hypothetical protein